jgi:hypothetical protein
MSAGISELSSRSGDGIDVTLLWQRCDNTAFVAVADRRTGEEFSLDINEDDNALDMFHHPFAYAAHRPSAAQRDAAESAVRQLTGVRALGNLIEVKPRTEPTVAGSAAATQPLR